jgi:hypothetical protein
MFFDLDAMRQRCFGIIGEHWGDCLSQTGACIHPFIDKVNRATRYRHSRIQHVTMGVCSGKIGE